MKIIVKVLVILRNYLIYRWFTLLALLRGNILPFNSKAIFVTSIACYPDRIHLLPAVFESIARQTIMPSNVYLVLSVEEWPDKKVPRYIEKLVRRGVEIVWTRNNTYSVKMLIPILALQPDKAVITLGDDFIYGRTFLENSACAKEVSENSIVGPLGKILVRKGNDIGMYYREKKPADRSTNINQLYLMGLGTYYPPNSLDIKVVDLEAITSIIPGRGSDLWFWAAAVAKGTKQVCLGEKSVAKILFPIPENKKTKPRDTPGKSVMEERFQKTIDYFGIREKLLSELPNKEL